MVGGGDEREESASEKMDFLTHSLMGAGAARLVAPRRDWRPQLALAAVLGSTLMDGDSWVALLGANHYGFYHRTVTHSIVGLIVLAGVAAVVAKWVSLSAWGRRFGWFIAPNRMLEEAPTTSAPWGWFLLVAATAAALHWCGDVITGFGNMCPFWPWDTRDVSLRAVFSFDWFIFSATLGWHIAIRRLDWPRRREWALTAVYVVCVAGYVWARLRWGAPTFC